MTCCQNIDEKAVFTVHRVAAFAGLQCSSLLWIYQNFKTAGYIRPEPRWTLENINQNKVMICMKGFQEGQVSKIENNIRGIMTVV